MRITTCWVRHGESAKVGRKVEDKEDGGPPLSKLGHAQARVVAERLAAYPWEAVISSPLNRAAQTAQAIGTRCNVTVCLDSRLTEFSEGEFVVMKGSTAEGRTTGSAACTRRTELRAHFRRRVGEALRELGNGGWGKRVIVVSHSGVMNEILAIVLGIRSLDRFHIDTTGIVRLTLNHSESAVVKSVNDIWHLEDPLAIEDVVVESASGLDYDVVSDKHGL
ncbi:MAG: histidine phosphatase family protein [Candidatus Dormibacteria bacterium]